MKTRTAQSSPYTEQEFRSALRSHNLRATEQRLSVHRVMCELVHASADAVAQRLAEDLETGPKVTVASVYNILNQLAQAGIYSARLSRNNKMYFDVCPASHIHFYDTVGHVFEDILVDDDAWLQGVEQKLRTYKLRGYRIDSVDIQINCHPSTRKKKKKL